MASSERSVSIELDMREEGPWLFTAEEPSALEQEPPVPSPSATPKEEPAQWVEVDSGARDSFERVAGE